MSSQPLLQRPRDKRIALPVRVVRTSSLPSACRLNVSVRLQQTRADVASYSNAQEPKVFFANERTFLSWLSFSYVNSLGCPPRLDQFAKSPSGN